MRDIQTEGLFSDIGITFCIVVEHHKLKIIDIVTKRYEQQVV